MFIYIFIIIVTLSILQFFLSNKIKTQSTLENEKQQSVYSSKTDIKNSYISNKEGERVIDKHIDTPTLHTINEKFTRKTNISKEDILRDKKKLIIYSEIMKRKF